MALDDLVTQLERTDPDEYGATRKFLNIAVYYLLAARDMQAVKVDALSHKDDWKRNLALRVMLLIMYEWKMDKVASAKEMTTAFENAGISVGLREEMTISLRGLNKAHNKARKLLSPVRHATIAHRDAESLKQYQLMKNLDPLETTKVMADFYSAGDSFLDALKKLIVESGSLGSMLKQRASYA